MSEYDNTNRAPLWPGKAVVGKADIEGKEHRCILVQTGFEKPSHDLFLTRRTQAQHGDGYVTLTYHAAVFREAAGEGKRIAGGRITVDGVEYWINVYPVEGGKENSPKVRIQFRPVEDKQGGAKPPRIEGVKPNKHATDADEDEIPF